MTIVTISEAAKIAGTSRQNIDNKKAFPDKWDFFVPGGVNKDHPDFIKLIEMIKANKRRKAGLPKDPDPIGGVDRFSLFVSAVEEWCDIALIPTDHDRIKSLYQDKLKKISGE